jgi:signal transduction histidine kinase
VGAWADVRGRLRPLLDRYGDAALAGLMAAAAIGEAARSDGTLPPLTLLATIPLVWRRRWPAAVMLAVLLGALISWEAPYSEITCAGIAAYSIGAHERRRLFGLLELVAVGVLAVAFFGDLQPTPLVPGPFLVLLLPWLVGNEMRQSRARARELAERAGRLERERQLTLQVAQAGGRARIARELHDVIAHTVSVMVVQAGAARQVVDQSPERASDALRAVEDTGREAMQELRRVLGVLGDGESGLAPQPALDQVGALVASVREAGLPVDLEVRGVRRTLPATVELAAYRVIQEALTNAVKHSGLAPTRVAIEYRPDELQLEILCDGDGDGGRPAGGAPGRGVAGMRERVSLLGGRIEAGPGIERGYNVRAWLPMPGAM